MEPTASLYLEISSFGYICTIVEDKNTCQAGIDRLLNKYEFYHYGFDHNDQYFQMGMFGHWNFSTSTSRDMGSATSRSVDSKSQHI